MPYDHESPEETRKIERCVDALMKDKTLIAKYPDPKERKSHAIAICKSQIIK